MTIAIVKLRTKYPHFNHHPRETTKRLLGPLLWSWPRWELPGKARDTKVSPRSTQLWKYFIGNNEVDVLYNFPIVFLSVTSLWWTEWTTGVFSSLTKVSQSSKNKWPALPTRAGRVNERIITVFKIKWQCMSFSFLTDLECEMEWSSEILLWGFDLECSGFIHFLLLSVSLSQGLFQAWTALLYLW